jgi:hypothetical protein
MVDGCRRLAILMAAAMLAGASAHAQSSACDDFKAVLAARIESTGVRGYSLEVVPAGAPVPSGAKVIATCESGVRKILYRRWGAAKAAAGAASTASAAAPSPPAVQPEVQARRLPAARVDRAPQAVPASAVSMSTAVPLQSPASSASDAVVAGPVDRALVQAVPAKSDATPVAEASPARQGFAFTTGYWPWIAALLLLILARWAWRRYFSPYDKDGLPRGPRL